MGLGRLSERFARGWKRTSFSTILPTFPAASWSCILQRRRSKAERALTKKDAAGNGGNNDIPVWEASGAPPREGPKKYTGRSSGNFHRKGVTLLNSHYALVVL